MPMRSKTLDVNYELPKLIDRFLEGWLGTLNGGALPCTILAAVATTLFVHFQEQMKFANSGSSIRSTEGKSNTLEAAASTPYGDALLLFAYLSIIVNCGTAITSFFISLVLAETPFRSARVYVDDCERLPPKEGEAFNKALCDHLGWKSWRIFKLSWSLMLFFGIMCIFAELLIYLWIVEPSIGIKIAVSFSSVLILLPVMAFGVGLLYNSAA
ncbi:hypothetical protein M408DRAFT_22707 [Serendipita vermifera MAFF 305830]|uniref:Uncharacterized protein n=1 Tax=Serendipita vermifera MAFF 305830 TaxID=933852 RepID=A0A0C3BEE1_SERVB|nr:hypothetical protein M408DRAFT_22707 [Serendipita vermifera MAFF 305830]